MVHSRCKSLVKSRVKPRPMRAAVSPDCAYRSKPHPAARRMSTSGGGGVAMSMPGRRKSRRSKSSATIKRAAAAEKAVAAATSVERSSAGRGASLSSSRAFGLPGSLSCGVANARHAPLVLAERSVPMIASGVPSSTAALTRARRASEERASRFELISSTSSRADAAFEPPESKDSRTALYFSSAGNEPSTCSNWVPGAASAPPGSSMSTARPRTRGAGRSGACSAARHSIDVSMNKKCAVAVCAGPMGEGGRDTTPAGEQRRDRVRYVSGMRCRGRMKSIILVGRLRP